METYRSDSWSNAHFRVKDALAALLNEMRDCGYNPSLHISYDANEHHLLVDPVILHKHPSIKRVYLEYLDACHARDTAVEDIQSLPKLDLGFTN
ncbi:hypothetical protein C7445_10473 [Alicyclobacillus sacchari]|uniref:Uncharacterized protein n=2 Tax=Alicyclobacillus TaxID=29330 RepID=A0A1H2RP67_9BACL|nr:MULTISPECIES: hypothetical protein [Alicyclobacillus]KRW92543.1 hypothetical protein SD51_03475 [Alicyclobacillus tengchongensis]TDY49562.1 hypothetical protein C7445_10473 [Alicyclobacillus sacchari]SDW20970.1 hypothetical protein SAMN04489725_10376 [Alicyclobacillus hesperidum]GLG00039.1 hypothetical protein Alches_00780 [Alicyclobacillus hesperidum subsp. aegles]GLV13534.1 hypothetical protein Heshes_12180 [Alicyclobacillus hesperidum]